MNLETNLFLRNRLRNGRKLKNEMRRQGIDRE